MPLLSARFLAGALLTVNTAYSMVPPDRDMIQQYIKDGTLQQRIQFAKAIGNQKVNPNLLLRAQYKLKKRAMEKGLLAPSILTEPPPAWKDMPTTGTVKVFTILIDFNDYPHNEAVNSRAQVEGRVFGAGDSNVPPPYESYKQFYLRSSYNQLNLTGNVMGWYRPGYNRADMAQTTVGREALIKEALTYFHNQGQTFNQYDNNGDGKVDFFSVVWTGPDNGWANFWWGYQTAFNDDTFKLDGLSFGKYCWQWESRYMDTNGNMKYDGPFSPKTLIHEQGHGLGLPDYYDYDDSVGPRGGIGGLDMMDWVGDHNCFSKWLLDWITPDVVDTKISAGTKTLRDQSTNKDALIVMPEATSSTPFGEFYMVQNRQLTGNDANRPILGDGLLVWHVDSRLDSNNFNYVYDNSFTEHKLLRLMEADGLEEIETNAADANAEDFYVAGKEIGPTTLPNTSRYDGTWTNFGIRNISASAPAMSFDVYSIPADVTPPEGMPTKPSGTANLDAITFNWTQGTAADPDGQIVGYYLQVGSTPGASDVFDGRVGNVLTKTLTDLGRWDGQPVYARVRAMNTAGLYSSWSDVSDGVTIVLPVFADCAALDNCNLTFKAVGTWETDSDYYHQGTTSAHGLCPDNAKTTIQTRVTGPGNLSFWWKGSTERGFDFYTVMIDGVAQDRISGEVDWNQMSYEVPAGSHVISWQWAKDSNTTGALDKVWLDDVQYEQILPLAISQQPANQTVNVHSSVTFTVAVTGGKAPYTYQWFKNGAPISGATAPSYSFTTGITDDGTLYKVTVTDSEPTPVSVTSQEATLTVNGGIHLYQESEPNDTRALANVIPKPGVVTGTIATRRDIDVFKVTLNKGQRLSALATTGMAWKPHYSSIRMDCVDERGRIIEIGQGWPFKHLSVRARHNAETFYIRLYDGGQKSAEDYQLVLAF